MLTLQRGHRCVAPRIVAIAGALTAAVALALAARRRVLTDWPQWRGPERNGISRETGLASQWPAAGPPALWSGTSLGAGYGSLAVKGHQLFLQALRDRESVVTSLGRTAKCCGRVRLALAGTTIGDRAREARPPWTATACTS